MASKVLAWMSSPLVRDEQGCWGVLGVAGCLDWVAEHVPEVWRRMCCSHSTSSPLLDLGLRVLRAEALRSQHRATNGSLLSVRPVAASNQLQTSRNHQQSGGRLVSVALAQSP